MEKRENINQFTKDINKAIECNVASTILPIALIAESGNIMWHNDIFDELKSGKNFAGENILSIARGLNLKKILESDKDLHQRLKLNGRLYDVYSKEIFRNKKRLF